MCQSNIKTERKKRLKKNGQCSTVDPDAHISTWGDTKTSTAVVSKNESSSFTLIITQRNSIISKISINLVPKKALKNNRHRNSLLEKKNLFTYLIF